MEGELKAYYPDGHLRIEAHYKKGLVNGETRKYYPDGKIELIQKYDKGKLTYEKKYSEEGKVQYEDNY
jgi:antitoxin component YwqK of YwqJK toxin-antitoxin module